MQSLTSILFLLSSILAAGSQKTERLREYKDYAHTVSLNSLRAGYLEPETPMEYFISISVQAVTEDNYNQMPELDKEMENSEQFAMVKVESLSVFNPSQQKGASYEYKITPKMMTEAVIRLLTSRDDDEKKKMAENDVGINVYLRLYTKTKSMLFMTSDLPIAQSYYTVVPVPSQAKKHKLSEEITLLEGSTQVELKITKLPAE